MCRSCADEGRSLFKLWLSLGASSDVRDNTMYEARHNLEQLNDFISSVYYRSHAFIDIDDYTMHAFRIPKPKNSDSYDEETTA